MKYKQSVWWHDRDGRITVTTDAYASLEGAKKAALLLATTLGYVPRRWWQFWRWDEPRWERLLGGGIALTLLLAPAAGAEELPTITPDKMVPQPWAQRPIFDRCIVRDPDNFCALEWRRDGGPHGFLVSHVPFVLQPKAE